MARSRTVLIVGIGSSIGKAVAERFAADGWRIVVADQSVEAGAALVSQYPDQTLTLKLDITSDEDIAAAVASAAAFGGDGLDALVNLAVKYPSVQDFGPGASRNAWLEVLNVGLVGAARLVDEATPYLRPGSGIILFASNAALAAMPGLWLYPVCKSAIVQLTRSLAATLAPRQIRVNVVAPSWTWSTPFEMIFAGDRAAADAAGVAYHPLGRIGGGDEVANVCYFLCSQEASWVTGVTVPVDGGYALLGPEGMKPFMSEIAAKLF
jgi:3-oxoacyl-[acyl-carrier protein] reductase